MSLVTSDVKNIIYVYFFFKKFITTFDSLLGSEKPFPCEIENKFSSLFKTYEGKIEIIKITIFFITNLKLNIIIQITDIC